MSPSGDEKIYFLWELHYYMLLSGHCELLCVSYFNIFGHINVFISVNFLSSLAVFFTSFGRFNKKYYIRCFV
jgi:hypothetical protein